MTLSHPVTPGSIGDVEALFKAFADPTRLRILNILVAGELCVCDIVTILDLPQPMVSRHLALLRNADLVEVTREWKYAHYRLAAPANSVHRTLTNCVRSRFAGIDSLDREREVAARRVEERESDPC